MRLIRALFCAAAVAVAAPVVASPITIVDTGAGVGGQSNDWSLGFSNQWLASEFLLAVPATVTSVEGWIDPVLAGQVAFSLYSDGGEIPGSELFSQTAALGTGPGAWLGISGLNWFLNPGTYWVTFETRAGSTFQGTMPGGSPSPLGNEAFRTAGWNQFDSLNIGVRILGDADVNSVPVPEPGSLVLLGSGIAALYRRRKRRHV